MVGHFTLPVSSWFADYYDPMQKRIDELGSKYKVAALDVIHSAQREIDGFKVARERSVTNPLSPGGNNLSPFGLRFIQIE